MRFYLLTFAVVLYTALSAQQSGLHTELELGPELENLNKRGPENIYDTLGRIGDSYYYVCQRMEGLSSFFKPTIRAVSADLSADRVLVLPEKYGKADFAANRVTRIEDDFYAFGSVYDKKSKEQWLVVYTVDGATLELVGEGRVLRRLPRQEVGREGRYAVSQANASGMVVVSYESRTANSGGRQDRIYEVLDARQQLLYTHIVPTREGSNERIIAHAELDPAGNLYLIGYEQPANERRSDPNDRHRYIYAVTQGGNQTTEREITPELGSAADPLLWIDQGNTLSLTGILYDRAGSGALGIYLHRFDRETLLPVFTMEQRITATEENWLRPAAAQEETATFARDYLAQGGIWHLLQTADGGGYLHLETYGRRDITSPSGRALDIHTFSDQLILRFGSTGEIAWVRPVPHRMDWNVFTSFTSAGTFAATQADTLLLIFHSSREQMGHIDSRPRTKKNFAKGNVVLRCLKIGPDNTVAEGLIDVFDDTRYGYGVSAANYDPHTRTMYALTGRSYNRKYARVVVP
ncbi:hypothetical protein [Lewinella sp. IMCC34191]|uniref:hypothetical protein n=1 Tax=Lewinella sp. IMCC34191 TaxID=2259172 RepID=UPI000E27C0D2|nr:hypothetical protein [Lewinella sp. IMCC34191]